MDFDGMHRTAGSARIRNWRTEPRKRRYDEWMFKVIQHGVETLDQLISRTQLLQDREAAMKEGF